MKDDPSPDTERLLGERSEKVVAHAKGLSFLFKKIEPLARTRRSPNRSLNVKTEIENSFAIFASEIEEKNIEYEIIFNEENINISATEIDLITVFSNLIENSIFWLDHEQDKARRIKVHGIKEESRLVVEYSDNGPGFQGGNLELMFEPGYSMNPNGSGLGLSLAGEAISRAGGAIEAKKSDGGAMFELIFEGVLQ